VSITDELLENTAGHAWAFSHGALPMPPAKRVAVLACMDACLNVHGILGLEEQDAGVIRTAGGVVSDYAIGSLLASQRLLGIGEIVLIHYTDCGMLSLGDDEVKAAVGAETGLTPPFALEAFADLTGTSAGRWRIKVSPFMPHNDAIRGFVCDVARAPCAR
jgi:carbonic anhydrase